MDERLQAIFAARYGISLDHLNGKHVSTARGYQSRNDPYGVHLGAKAMPEAFDGRVDALRIHRLERFSNSLAQLCHASHLARRLGVKIVEIPDAWYVRPGKTTLADGLMLVNGTGHFSRLHTRLEGRFFYCRTLQSLAAPQPGFRSLLSQLQPAIRVSSPDSALPDDHLVVHLRSGDVFEADPHPAYYQPPLAFYLKVLKRRDWSHVHLVFEDFANPVVLALTQYCQGRGIGVSLHSWGLDHDIAFLLRGRHFAAGRGTFMQGVIALAPFASTVYSFWPFDPDNVWGLEGVENILIADRKGRYLKRIRPWHNTVRQRSLMLSYPLKFLRESKPGAFRSRASARLSKPSSDTCSR
ncbi:MULTISPECIES: hypothetical protein [Aphanothece]|uniref:hypothetical protein n=1 Tax=Aphanothece TaxID=1121 RepID=UPI003985093D